MEHSNLDADSTSSLPDLVDADSDESCPSQERGGMGWHTDNMNAVFEENIQGIMAHYVAAKAVKNQNPP